MVVSGLSESQRNIFRLKSLRNQKISGFMWQCRKNLTDLVEKQIHGAYPGADIKQVEEYSIFSENGKSRICSSLCSKYSDYMPIRVFRDLPTDPLSSITSVLAKMRPGEGAAIQILIQPTEGKWHDAGRSYISKVKKDESNPEKASFKVDPKRLRQSSKK